MVFLIDGAGSGEILPFAGFTLVDVLDVARFEVGVALDDLAVFYHATTDTGGKGEVKRTTLELISFGEGGQISVIVYIDREAEISLEHSGKAEIVPVEIAEPDSFVALDDAWHRDRDGLEARNAEIDADLLKDDTVVLLLILDSGEFDRVKDFARATYEGYDSFGATDVNTEIHDISIALAGASRNNR